MENDGVDWQELLVARNNERGGKICGGIQCLSKVQEPKRSTSRKTNAQCNPRKTMESYITKLPLAQGYNTILVVYNCFSKMAHFIATTEKTSAEGLAMLFWDHVWKLHGLLESIISDRGAQFAAGMMKELNNLLGIQTKLSTAYHPQTDRQTERINQELEQYLRVFIDHRQE